MAENDAPQASETAANDAQAAAGGSDAPIGQAADVEPAIAAAADAGQAAADDEKASTSSDGGESGQAAGDGGFDVEDAEGRLAEVGDEIDKARQALADMEDEVEPKPDGPPIAEGEGAANAPPG